MYLTVSPAYGRDFKSQKEAKAAWEEGKDFVVRDMMSKWCGCYINKADAKANGVTGINIRFSQDRKVAVVRV